MKKKDFVVIGAALLLALVFFVLFKLGVLTPAALPVGPQGDAGAVLTLSADDGTNAAVQLMNRQQRPADADSYVVVTVGRQVYQPVPLAGERVLTIDQPGGKQNVAHVRDGEILMNSATCDNQKCVHQGSVSLDNRDLRALYNQIICTPNEVVLTVLSRQEASGYYQEAP